MERSTPIEQHGFLSDRHSAALTNFTGDVDWLCFPRFDSPAIFSGLLGDAGGHWSVRPSGDFTSSQRYIEHTMVLETEFTTGTGVLVVTDALATGPAGSPHTLGSRAPHLLVRRAECTAGWVDVDVEFVPRPEFGVVQPVIEVHDGGLAAFGGADVLALSSTFSFSAADAAAVGHERLSAGQAAWFGLQWAPLGSPAPEVASPEALEQSLARTVAAWQNWSSIHHTYHGEWEDLVERSGLVLAALTYQPTGAIVAAPTTSLPELAGGERNWDYRYAWIRDASFTMDALHLTACADEARDFFAFMTQAAAVHDSRAHLQIVYGIGGERDLSERELPQLDGWRSSRPVRVGNGAWRQQQLDVYGELLDTAARFTEYWRDSVTMRRFLAGLADAATECWPEQDQGIWESRAAPQHFLYSKLMCWVAVDRAIRLAPLIDMDGHAARWERARAALQEAILTRGWSRTARAFAQAFGSDALDASLLALPDLGFLPTRDPRVIATIDAVERQLTDPRGLVLRYRTEQSPDGLDGSEGSFLMCTFWLARAQALVGRPEQARKTFERAAAYAGELGLLSEQVDSCGGQQLGNYPQAFSHVGLITAAWAITRAEKAQASVMG